MLVIESIAVKANNLPIRSIRPRALTASAARFKRLDRTALVKQMNNLRIVLGVSHKVFAPVHNFCG
jgi:hypothetical protein